MCENVYRLVKHDTFTVMSGSAVWIQARSVKCLKKTSVVNSTGITEYFEAIFKKNYTNQSLGQN